MNKYLKSKNFYIILLVITVIIMPIFINWLVTTNLSVSFIFDKIETNNDWISFYGSYLGGIIGGLFTLFGVMLTINKNDKQRKRTDIFQFENTFFKLISLHNNLAQDITIQKDAEEKISGRDALKWFSNELKNKYKTSIEEDYKTYDVDITLSVKYRIIKQVFEQMFNKHENSLSHYIRTFSNILKTINDVNNKDYYIDYTSILRAQLSTPEIIIIFYYALTYAKEDQLVYLLEETNIIDNNEKNILISEDHYNIFLDIENYSNENIDDVDIFLK